MTGSERQSARDCITQPVTNETTHGLLPTLPSLHKDMTLSTTQLPLRLALALLLPLWARSTTQDEVWAVFLMTALLAILAYQTRFAVDFGLAKDAMIAVYGTFIASYVADYYFVGPWMRLAMAYIFSWDALQYILPLTEHYVRCFPSKPCYPYLMRIQIRVREARQKPLGLSPILNLALVMATKWTIYLGLGGYLNTQGSRWRTLGICLMTVCATGDALQHCAIGVRHMVSCYYAASHLEIADTPGPFEPELERDDTVLSTEEKSVYVLASMSEDDKCKYWAEGSLVPLGYCDWELLMAQVISEIPTMQRRPSTRRRAWCTMRHQG